MNSSTLQAHSPGHERSDNGRQDRQWQILGHDLRFPPALVPVLVPTQVRSGINTARASSPLSQPSQALSHYHIQCPCRTPPLPVGIRFAPFTSGIPRPSTCLYAHTIQGSNRLCGPPPKKNPLRASGVDLSSSQRAARGSLGCDRRGYVGVLVALKGD